MKNNPNANDLQESNLELRRITENELELLMNWRMREDINAMMFNTVHLTMSGQRKWFNKIKNSEQEIRWIIWRGSTPVGSMYLVDIDHYNMRCESGWFIAEKTGINLKDVIALQQNLCDYIFYVLGLNRVYGYVIDNNHHAIRLLAMCGIEKEGLLVQHIQKDGRSHDVFIVGLVKEIWERKRNTMKYGVIKIE